MDGIMKNIRKAEVLTLKEQIAYQEGQVVSRTLAQNSAVSVTLFSFDKGRRSVPMNPAVTLSWSAWTARAGSRLTARSICCMRGNPLSCPRDTPMPFMEWRNSRCCWWLCSKSAGSNGGQAKAEGLVTARTKDPMPGQHRHGMIFLFVGNRV